MKKLLLILILLIPVKVWANLTATEGLAIDLSSVGAGLDMTIDFDPTELLGNRTWGDGSTDTIIWTWNRATGTDPTITFNNGSIGLLALTLTTDLAVAEGGTGASTFTDGGPLLGSGAGAITAMSVLGDGEIIIGDGTTDPVALDIGSSTSITILGTIATGVWQGTAIADAYIPDNITIDLATLATTLTITDNESTAENNPIVFVAGADPDGGNLGLETDGDFHYNPSTGTVTATEFVGGGAGITSVDAITGDSATAFFDAGTIEHERGGIEADISAIADGGVLVGTGAGTMAIRASFLTGGAAGFIKHELGGLEADINAYTGLVAITGGATAEVDSKSELEGHIADVADFAEADGDTYSNNHDFGSADLELPQASPAVPNADGEIEIDFTDGKMVIQHGSAHAELGASTDVVMGTLIRCWGGTIFEPDGVNDVMTVKAINSIEFPHGVVITAIYLGISSDTNYTLTVQNFDDFDTINGANGTIDTVAYTADTTGEIIDTTPTYATIAAGQLIMISIPSTDVDWIHFEIYYYEPAA